MRNHVQQAARQRVWNVIGRRSASSLVLRWHHAMMRADTIEMPIVRKVAGMTHFRVVRDLTFIVNLLGNGWIYPPIAVALYLSGSPQAWSITGTALAAAVGSHAIYAVIKRLVARLRPFERDPSMPSLARVLDRYSFPSGHCMTLTAVLVPIVHRAPLFWPYALIALTILAWCRIAAAHHYPSDVIAGICLGMAVSAPLTLALISA